MNRRAGVTLLEVLISIFVVALGLLALLTLFPLGALSMAQALKDDRVAQTAANAASTLRIFNVTQDTTFITPSMNPGNTLAGDQQSYAVFFDPIGYYHYGGAAQTQIGGVPGVTRCTTNYFQNPAAPVALNQAALVSAWFTSLDDLTFVSDGSAMGVPVNPVERVGGFSWGAMLRRPHAAESPTEVYIVVYSGRSTDLTGALAPAGETVLSVASASGNLITVNYVGVAPDIRAGSWILDNTNAAGHGDFYRVTNVTVNANNTVDLELQTPIKVGNISQVVFMDNVAEVIYKGVIGP